jgi:hypothetical protein
LELLDRGKLGVVDFCFRCFSCFCCRGGGVHVYSEETKSGKSALNSRVVAMLVVDVKGKSVGVWLGKLL